MNSTNRVILSMLRENTGRHMLDSGGAYGRNFERNRKHDPRRNPSATVRFGWYDENGGDWYFDELTLDLYHFLTTRLDYAPEINRMFTRHCNRSANRGESWFDNLETFREWLELHGHTMMNTMTVNTYNGDDLLSQVIQYTEFDLESDTTALDGHYVALMIHGGCDVRGGYSRPRFFTCEDYALSDNDRVTVYCDKVPVYAPDLFGGETEVLQGEHDIAGAHYWYYVDAGNALNNSECPDLATYPGTGDVALRGKGYVYIDEDGNGYCPLCGNRLRAANDY